MRAPSLHLGTVTGLVVAVALALLPGVLHAEPGAAELRISAPVQATVGDEVELQLTLLTAEGEPIEGATITLYEQVAFMDTKPAEVVVSGAATDAAGRAAIHYIARREGARSLTVRYEGDEEHAAAAVTVELPVLAGDQTYLVERLPGIPGVNRFLVVGILVIVWGTMFIIAAHVVAIARAGADAPDGEVAA
jgi:hypothetical protein